MADKKVQGTPVFHEIGSTGLRESGGFVYEEFIKKLQWPRAGDIYQEMSSNDPVITAVLFCCRMLIQRVTWHVKPASDAQADLDCAEFVESCMNDMSETWTDFIDEVISYFSYGYSYHEIVYKKRQGDSKQGAKRSQYNDGRIGWRKLPGRRQTTLTNWDIADDGGIRGVYQLNDSSYVYLPIERGLLFRTANTHNNPEGISFLRGAYRPWYFKKHIEEVEGIGIERDLAGLPVIMTPEGLDLSNTADETCREARLKAESLVSSIRRDRNDGVVLGFGWDLKLLSTGGSRQFDTNAIINRYDQRIAITLLADIIMLGADKVGSFALASVKQSLLATALDAQLYSICEVLNRYAIPRLIALNSFPGITGTPSFTCTSVVSPDLNALGGFISNLAGANMPLFPDLDLENYLRDAANLPRTEDAAECRTVAQENNGAPGNPSNGTDAAPTNSDKGDLTDAK
ncbi:MAG: hypothetical protein R3Y58_01805 [Eubacteriales bacterium]